MKCDTCGKTEGVEECQLCPLKLCADCRELHHDDHTDEQRQALEDFERCADAILY